MDKYTYEKELEREKSHGTGLLFIIGLNERHTCIFFLLLALPLGVTIRQGERERERRIYFCFRLN